MQNSNRELIVEKINDSIDEKREDKYNEGHQKQAEIFIAKIVYAFIIILGIVVIVCLISIFKN